ncbi:MAG: histidine kinase, partial [Anaerolineae bacterium]|nr:histidine kinase [Anaerolineae bacterium]
DMHDGVTQMVLGALYETQAAKDVIETNPSRAKHNLIRAQQFLTDIDTEIRQVIYDLHPPVLDVMGMVVSLRWFAQSFSKTFNIDCQILVDGEAHRLAKSAEIALYRILQAALQNVAAHAQATQAVVKFDFGRECFKVAVCDDGVGFNPQLVFTTPGEHLGLIGMKERTESIGADLVVNSILGHGTEILVQLPFPQYVD